MNIFCYRIIIIFNVNVYIKKNEYFLYNALKPILYILS